MINIGEHPNRKIDLKINKDKLSIGPNQSTKTIFYVKTVGIIYNFKSKTSILYKPKYKQGYNHD